MVCKNGQPNFLDRNCACRLPGLVSYIRQIEENSVFACVLQKHQSVFDEQRPPSYAVPYALAPKVAEDLYRLQKSDIIESVQYSDWTASCQIRRVGTNLRGLQADGDQTQPSPLPSGAKTHHMLTQPSIIPCHWKSGRLRTDCGFCKKTRHSLRLFLLTLYPLQRDSIQRRTLFIKRHSLLNYPYLRLPLYKTSWFGPTWSTLYRPARRTLLLIVWSKFSGWH